MQKTNPACGDWTLIEHGIGGFIREHGNDHGL